MTARDADAPVVAVRPRALGDVVLVTPALRALARGHAQRPLHVVTDARYAPLIEGLPFVSKVWHLERSTFATLALGRALRAARPAVFVDFFGNPRTALLARLTGAARSFGYDLRGRGRAYDVAVPRHAPPAHGAREHASAVHVRLALAAGGVAAGLEPELSLGAADRREAEALLARAEIAEPARTVGLVAAGTWPTKTWPLAHAARLANELHRAGHPVLLIGGPGEDAIARRLTALAPGVRVLPPCGVAALAAVIAGLRAVVGTDSGPRHIAAAFGVPTFAWFGPTHPDTWNPPGPQHGYWQTALPCRACDRTRCPHWNCLPGLEAPAAARLVLTHLERHGRPATDFGPTARP